MQHLRRRARTLQLCAACATAWNTFAMVLRATLITVAVGVIVYKCKKWCADVVARIEAIEATIQVMQNPPPPRHDLLNMYSGEIGICVLLFYFVGLYQHSL